MFTNVCAGRYSRVAQTITLFEMKIIIIIIVIVIVIVIIIIIM